MANIVTLIVQLHSLGWYVYLEASKQMPNSVAELKSPVLLIPNGGGCLRFWYHMFGMHIGSLSVEAVLNNNKRTRLFSSTRLGGMCDPTFALCIFYLQSSTAHNVHCTVTLTLLHL